LDKSNHSLSLIKTKGKRQAKDTEMKKNKLLIMFTYYQYIGFPFFFRLGWFLLATSGHSVRECKLGQRKENAGTNGYIRITTRGITLSSTGWEFVVTREPEIAERIGRCEEDCACESGGYLERGYTNEK